MFKDGVSDSGEKLLTRLCGVQHISTLALALIPAAFIFIQPQPFPCPVLEHKYPLLLTGCLE